MNSRRLLPIMFALLSLARSGPLFPVDPELPHSDLLKARMKSFCRAMERQDSAASFLLTLYHAKQLATLAQWSADWQSARDETISNCKCGPPQRLAGKDFKMLASLLHDKGVEIDSAAYSKIRYRVRDKGGESDTGEGL